MRVLAVGNINMTEVKADGPVYPSHGQEDNHQGSGLLLPLPKDGCAML